MSKFMRFLWVCALAASVSVPAYTHASQNGRLACSVSIDYVLNNVLRQSYQKDFVIDPNTPFSDDFSTATRFRFFDASTTRQSGDSVVTISYFNDVGVFTAVDFRTTLTMRDDKDGETISGSHTFFTSIGAVGNHTTNYTLTCQRAQD